MKTFLTSFHACRNNSCRRPGFEKTVHKKGGWPSRASCNPARIARRTATAGWRISRKVIGPSERPMRFSHPRLSASSTIHLPGRAPLNGTTAAYLLGAIARVRLARTERPDPRPRSPEDAVPRAMSPPGIGPRFMAQDTPPRRRSWRGSAEASGISPALIRAWFSPLLIQALAILPGRLRLHQDRGPREAPGLVGAGRHRSSIERGAPSTIAATRPQQRRSARHPPAS